MEKILCIYHSQDLDGWMSAAIVKKWFVDNNNEFVVVNIKDINKAKPLTIDDKPTLYMLGWTYGDTISDLSGYDKVIMCDISFPKEEMFEIANKFSTNFIWIDHHQRTIDEVNDYLILNNSKEIEGLVTEPNELKAACELTWEYFFSNDEIPEIVRLLGRYDCFGHKGTDEEEYVLKFQYAARANLSNYTECYSVLSMPSEHQDTFIWKLSEQGEGIYKYLCTEAKQTYKKAFEINLGLNKKIKMVDVATVPDLEPETLKKAEGQYLPYRFICVNKERFNPINFGIDYHKDGYDGAACFWYNDGKWNFSLYNDNRKVDCSAIAKQYGGGGHKGAAGFIVDDLNKILTNYE